MERKLDAVGAPIPDDLACDGTCPKYASKHTHVRGNWNRPGYTREACEVSGSASCEEHRNRHHCAHFHWIGDPE